MLFPVTDQAGGQDMQDRASAVKRESCELQYLCFGSHKGCRTSISECGTVPLAGMNGSARRAVGPGFPASLC